MVVMAPADQSAQHGQVKNTTGAPPRIPKLAVKNPASQEYTPPSSAPHAHVNAPSPSLHTAFDQPPPSPAETSSSGSPSSYAPSSASSNLAPHASSSTVSKGQKKKASAVLGFLTLKEPSQSALRQFAEQQQRQATGKGVKQSTTAFAGQKLPTTVPKVNSKWDGIPDALKSRDTTSPKRKSIFSMTDSVSRPSSSNGSTKAWGTRIGTSSLASSTRSSDLQPSLPQPSFVSPEYQAGNAVSRPINGAYFNPAAAGLTVRTSLKSPSTSSLPTISHYFPEEPTHQGRRVETPSCDASPASLSIDLTRQAIAPVESHSPVDKVNPSQVGRSGPGPAADSADPNFALMDHSKGRHAFLAGEARPLKLPGEKDTSSHEVRPTEVGTLETGKGSYTEKCLKEHRTETHDHYPVLNKLAANANLGNTVAAFENGSLDAPAVLDSHSAPAPLESLPPRNFSRPLSYQTPLNKTTAEHRLTSPAFPSGTPAAVDSSLNDAEGVGVSPIKLEHSRNLSSSHSVASSVAPSEMSAQWFQSSRERLGLGGRIKKSDSVPWTEGHSSSQGKRKMGRLSVFGKSNFSD